MALDTKWRDNAKHIIELCWDAYEDESYDIEKVDAWTEERAKDFCREHIEDVYARGDGNFIFREEKRIENELNAEGVYCE
jgi:hypothetical protein